MAGIKTRVTSDFSAFYRFVKQFPAMSADIASYIGSQSRVALIDNFLSGQEIQLSAYPVDARGGQTTKSRVLRSGKTVVVTSYPVNLFENGRLLRDGSFEAPKQIITVKLKAVVSQELNSYSDKAVKKIFDEKLKEI